MSSDPGHGMQEITPGLSWAGGSCIGPCTGADSSGLCGPQAQRPGRDARLQFLGGAVHAWAALSTCPVGPRGCGSAGEDGRAGASAQHLCPPLPRPRRLLPPPRLVRERARLRFGSRIPLPLLAVCNAAVSFSPHHAPASIQLWGTGPALGQSGNAMVVFLSIVGAFGV